MTQHFAATASEEAQKINDEAGESPWGMTLVTDQEFWEKQGISTGEELAIAVLGQTYSDLHKDARGFRPRQWKKDVDWLNQAIDALDKEMEDALRDEELEALEIAQQEKDRAEIESLMPQPDDYEDLPARSGMGRRHEGKIRVTRAQLERIILEELDRPLNEGAIDWMQGGLDIIGLVPGIGEAADGLNAAISLARGNPIEAVLSGISMIPVGGDVVGKSGKVLLKILDPARGKAEELLKKASQEMDTDSMEAFFNFISSDITQVADGEGEEADAEASKEMASAVSKLAAGLMHPRGEYLLENNTIIGYVLGDAYINEQLLEIAKFFKDMK